MGLTKDQEIALYKLQEFVRSHHKYFRLTGYAGTGKSYLIAQFMEWLLGQNINFTAASPTNKAARNLARLAKENDLYSVEVTTVAKLLGQQPELNEDSGKEEFVTNDSSIGSYQVVIIDEFSMISKANFEDITWEAKYSDTKIVFVGDAGQLPPVGLQKNLTFVGQSRKGAFILSYWLRSIDLWSMEAPFADEIPPIFCPDFSIYVLKLGAICPT